MFLKHLFLGFDTSSQRKEINETYVHWARNYILIYTAFQQSCYQE